MSWPVCALLAAALAWGGTARAEASFAGPDGAPRDPQTQGVSPAREPPPSAAWLRAQPQLPVDWLQPRASARVHLLEVVSRDARGQELARTRLRRLSNGRFEALRPVLDELDLQHVEGTYRSIRVQFAGTLELLEPGGQAPQWLRVSGPYGPAGMRRLRAHAVALGYARELGVVPRRRLQRALLDGVAPWAQCGIGIDPELRWELRGAPPSHLLSLGAGLSGAPSGGELQLRIEGKPLRVPIVRGEALAQLAERIARAAAAQGYLVQIAQNSRPHYQTQGGLDLSFRRADGEPVSVRAGQPLSTDTSLSVQLAAASLRDGVAHFRNEDAQFGSADERQLLRALSPRARDEVLIVLVPSFGGDGRRLGESFIRSDRSGLSPAVLVTHVGLALGASAMVLAHELGHVLLDEPGHADSHGADTPSQLMDADAADPSAYGPRRLSLAECERARRRATAAGLLEPWPQMPVAR